MYSELQRMEVLLKSLSFFLTIVIEISANGVLAFVITLNLR